MPSNDPEKLGFGQVAAETVGGAVPLSDAERIAKLEAELAASKVIIATQAAMIVEKDATIAFQAETIAAQTARIAAKNAEIGELTKLAYFDPLTELANRRGGLEKATKIVTEACQQSGKIGVLRLDLDRFKAVNDLLGHNHGDEVLKTISEAAKEYLDVAGVTGEHLAVRDGGDEFYIVMNCPISEEALLDFGNRMQARMQGMLVPITDAVNTRIAERLQSADPKDALEERILEPYKKDGKLTVGVTIVCDYLETQPHVTSIQSQFAERTRRRPVIENAGRSIFLGMLKNADTAGKDKGRGTVTLANKSTIDDVEWHVWCAHTSPVVGVAPSAAIDPATVPDIAGEAAPRELWTQPLPGAPPHSLKT